ncbi:alkaline phosphatase family protein [Microbacterium sp. LTA6]|uniref:alkaline phosphatase family protein n=1 Tax=Microbacterium sp. LTA6 TaxID=3129771 RepID=UPI00325197B2
MPRFRRALCATSAGLIATALAVSVPTAAHAAEHEGLPDGTHTTKTLVIGIDGASFDFLAPASMANLTDLRERGTTSASNLFANPMAGTVSGAGWSSIATGVWPDKHNVVDNNFTDPNFAGYPDYLTRIEAADPAASNLVVGTWTPIPEIVFGSAVDLRVAGGNDDGTTERAVDYLGNGNPDNVFVHLDEVDGAGHSVGTNGPAYATALQRADQQIGQMLDAIRNRPTYANEEWLVVVTADHGHRPTGGHGGNSLAERKTFVIAAGPGIPAGVTRHDVKIVDIAPLVLGANGIATDAGWDLDGRPLDALVPDAFDSLRPQLRGQVDETRPGDGVLGWTNTAPEGWSIDNSKMPDGGVTEWRGWGFATDEFWTATDGGQMRETSVRNRDVFAVADSDEWDDRSHGAGQFDSTLVGPKLALNGAPTATLSFATNYFIDGPQSAEVLVSFDGASAVSLKSYKVDTNRFEKLGFEVPAGAETAQFSFHYTGQNSAFWTIDQVELLQDEPPAPVLPEPPTGVQPTAGDAKIVVNWQASAGETPVTGYTATATQVDGAQAHIAATSCDTTELSCEIPGLVNGATYTVTVIAHSAVGDSVPSAISGPVVPKAAGTGGGSTPPTDGGAGNGPGGPAGGNGAVGNLAVTGADPAPLLTIGGLVLAVGALLTAIGVRRKTASRSAR